MSRLLLILILTGFCSFIFSQEKHTISGYVKDAETGEALIGATVFLKEENKGAATNVYGFYSFTVESGSYQVKISFVGYKDFISVVDLKDDVRLNIELSV